MLQGANDCFRNWWLIVRCSAMGAALGTIPGVIGGVVDWLMYGHAHGDREGREDSLRRATCAASSRWRSSNNSKEAGQLVPAIAFGVPTTTLDGAHDRRLPVARARCLARTC